MIGCSRWIATPLPKLPRLGTNFGGSHLGQLPIRPQQQAITHLFQAAIHETNGADIPLTANEATRGLQQPRDGWRPEGDVESVRAMIVPYGVAFDLRRR